MKSFFFNKASLESRIQTLIVENSNLTDTIEDLKNQIRQQKELLKESKIKEKELTSLKETYIQEATTKLQKENTELKIKTNRQEAKIEIIEKAFDNFGEDVKETKSIIMELLKLLTPKK